MSTNTVTATIHDAIEDLLHVVDAHLWDGTAADVDEAAHLVAEEWDGPAWYEVGEPGGEPLLDWYEHPGELVHDAFYAIASATIRHSVHVWQMGDGPEPADW